MLEIAIHGFAKMAPELQSAWVDGTALTMTFSQDLDSGSTPAVSTFAASVDGTLEVPTNVAISGNTVTLTLTTAAAPGENVTVSYVKPSSNPLHHAGKAVAGFEDQSVDNLRAAVKLVGNTGRSGQTASGFGFDRAQAFTTGSATGGYQLTGVTLILWDFGSTKPTYSVSIHEDSSGAPGTSLGTLTNPGSLPGSLSAARFMTSPIDLDTNTTYWVVVDVTTPQNVNMGRTTNKGEDGGAATGWTIANSSLDRTHTSTGDWTTRTSHVVRVAFHGISKTATAPEFQSAVVDGMALTLTFSKALDTGSKPAASAFTVKVDGTAQADPTNVAISGNTVTLTPATAVQAGQSVTVSYAIPSSNPLRHADRLVAGFTDEPVTDNTLGKLVSNTGRLSTGTASFRGDYAQAFTTGSATGGYQLNELTLVMQDTGSTPPNYTVTIHSDSNGSPGRSLGTLTNPASLPSSLGEVRFTASSPIDLVANTTYWVVVDSNTSSNSVDIRTTSHHSEDDGAAAGWSIANSRLWRLAAESSWRSGSVASVLQIAVHGIAKTTPAFQSASVSGTTLSLVFSEALDTGSTPAAGAFTVKVAGNPRTITGTQFTNNSRILFLTLSPAVTAGQTVTVSYTVPSSNPLQHAGKWVASFTDKPVTNNTL